MYNPNPIRLPNNSEGQLLSRFKSFAWHIALFGFFVLILGCEAIDGTETPGNGAATANPTTVPGVSGSPNTESADTQVPPGTSDGTQDGNPATETAEASPGATGDTPELRPTNPSGSPTSTSTTVPTEAEATGTPVSSTATPVAGAEPTAPGRTTPPSDVTGLPQWLDSAFISAGEEAVLYGMFGGGTGTDLMTGDGYTLIGAITTVR